MWSRGERAFNIIYSSIKQFGTSRLSVCLLKLAGGNFKSKFDVLSLSIHVFIIKQIIQEYHSAQEDIRMRQEKKKNKIHLENAIEENDLVIGTMECGKTVLIKVV
ncbi:hypothetical protein RF11_04739 [Thelohanellus kitauei]|uniref:Uncharacterized protein n=1 Tax=Thelohanellus kitauei TaxID=669202 RepID=A0A0C2JRZ7_THEKT|nr:hypothetical protein RF11_04739 [Thelohanellus kitauei]